MEIEHHSGGRVAAVGGDDDDVELVEQVRLTVPTTDDPTLPVWTFRMWTIGVVSCALLSFFNQFFAYRSEPIIISQITVQVAALPVGHFMARALPDKKFSAFGREWSMNPGPFNVKEHVLICVFANAGAAFGNGGAYAVGIVTIIKAFYRRNISFVVGLLLIITTQVLGYGWAGLMRRYVIEPAQMWWPQSLVQVSLLRALHEKEQGRRMTRGKFFLIALVCSFTWYTVPGYIFPTITAVSWVCWAFPKSVTMQQIGSGLNGLGVGAFTLDWSVVASFLSSPLVSPFFAIVNVYVGFVLLVYIIVPACYWAFNLYDAGTFPIYSTDLFTGAGQLYNITAIVNDRFEIDMGAYEQQGKIHLSLFFAISYGLGFASIAATLSHVALFYGKEIYQRFRESYRGKPDVHTRMMRRYDDIPNWWFYVLLALTMAVAMVLCTVFKDEVQLPWWGLLFACAIAFIFTLPISVITATTNTTPGLNVITEYTLGLIMPGKPIANVCFKVYGYMSMNQSVSFLNDFKLGHYMKVPPRSMFLVQLIGTVVAGTVNTIVAWWLLTTVPHICEKALLPEGSPWTCPGDHVFFDASVIWGLVGPRRIFGPLGYYNALNWCFLGGLVCPLFVWLLARALPGHAWWISLVNLPVILGATANMPPASTLNYTAWCFVGTVFNFFVFRYRKGWWKRYNYVLSAALDAGVAIMGVVIYFALSGHPLDWWGSRGEHCDLATCPTARGVQVDGCPIL
ncbi:hypothetical protein SETIT_7G220900v2 [Setaria italica]|uniref:Oligopeptide transporter 4 n=1 Tax=Setaria italica TaxID=4555 RepID=K3YEE0_SETIT|nr:oligopeptide transporter 4 [Setaria italica]RCV35193.1 hypothetical protein SETIT_7G220900v2 [Setaria italica]